MMSVLVTFFSFFLMEIRETVNILIKNHHCRLEVQTYIETKIHDVLLHNIS